MTQDVCQRVPRLSTRNVIQTIRPIQRFPLSFPTS